MGESLLDRVVCVRCKLPIDPREPSIACAACGQIYPRVGHIPVLLPRPDAHVELWRRQLGLIQAQGRQTRLGLEAQAEASDVRPSGKTRLHKLARAVGDQVDDIGVVLGPALGGPLPATAEDGLPRGVVEYLYYLYRDWAWPEGEHRENQHALDDIRDVASSGGFGRTLVLGAGGCRLAYDLHRSCGATDTAVIDIDPYLFVIAEAVVRGASVRLTESTPNVQEAEHVATSWMLSAPAPLDEKTFHFFLASGIEPPFADGTFDTIVTPWFIDQVPLDLQAFLGTLHRLARAGRGWINHGPLIYRPDESPAGPAVLARRDFRLGEQHGLSRWTLVGSLAPLPRLAAHRSRQGRVGAHLRGIANRVLVALSRRQGLELPTQNAW